MNPSKRKKMLFGIDIDVHCWKCWSCLDLGKSETRSELDIEKTEGEGTCMEEYRDCMD